MNMGVLSAGAIDPADTLKLSNDMFFGMLGNTIAGQYLGTDGQMHAITFNKGSANTNIAQTNMLGYTAADWQGYSCSYFATVPADFYEPAPSSGEHSVLILSPNLHYQNITYFKFGLTWLNTNGAWQSAYNSTPYTNFSPYVYLHAGDTISDTYSLSRRSDNTMGADTWNSLSQTRNPFLGFSDEGNWDDFYIGDIYISPIGARNSYFQIFFVCPTVNSDYLYAGHGIAPAEPVTTTVSTQTGGSGGIGGGGSVTTDASGATGFVYSASLVMPEYMYSGSFDAYSDSMPSVLSSVQSGMDSFGTTAVSALAAVADDTDIGGIWDIISEFLPPGIVTLIIGVSGIYIVGWVLTRYAG